MTDQEFNERLRDSMLQMEKASGKYVLALASLSSALDDLIESNRDKNEAFEKIKNITFPK